MTDQRPLYLLLSGAPTSGHEPVNGLVELLQNQGRHVTVLSTPMGARFHDLDALADLTGEPVRTEFRLPGTGRSMPPGAAVVACPWSFNSTNKTALGLTDTFAVALACEMIGRGVPTIIVPKAGEALAGHPAFRRSLKELEAMPSVSVLRSEEKSLPSWEEVAEAVAKATA
ncbi:flavoprotein [Nocardiopsis alba]|uniref:Flavoprotein n=1 Tax=Nocardiopsis alba TaxID=53437 RepID=A0A7K2IYI5_9ACTN|nr:flavoprotein [Nocardiopsis alba]MYR35048.1 flavoprotein [Nocardiopsis alba]